MSEGESKSEGPKLSPRTTAIIAIATGLLGLIAGLATYKKAIDLSTDLIAKVAETKKEVEGLTATYQQIKTDYEATRKKKAEIDAEYQEAKEWLEKVGPRIKELDPTKIKAVLDAVATSNGNGKAIAEWAGTLAEVVRYDPKTHTITMTADDIAIRSPMTLEDRVRISESGGELVVLTAIGTGNVSVKYKNPLANGTVHLKVEGDVDALEGLSIQGKKLRPR